MTGIRDGEGGVMDKNLERLLRIMGTFDLATGHAETMEEALDSLESELRDVLGFYRAKHHQYHQEGRITIDPATGNVGVGNVRYDTSNDLVMTNSSWQNTIIFTQNNAAEKVMTIFKDGVWVNPNMAVDEAATAVIDALDKHIKALVKHNESQGKPVAWASPNVIPLRGLKDNHMAILTPFECTANTVPLYTYQPKRQPLDDDEIRDCAESENLFYFENKEEFDAFARAIEAAHGIGVKD